MLSVANPMKFCNSSSAVRSKEMMAAMGSVWSVHSATVAGVGSNALLSNGPAKAKSDSRFYEKSS